MLPTRCPDLSRALFFGIWSPVAPKFDLFNRSKWSGSEKVLSTCGKTPDLRQQGLQMFQKKQSTREIRTPCRKYVPDFDSQRCTIILIWGLRASNAELQMLKNKTPERAPTIFTSGSRTARFWRLPLHFSKKTLQNA